VRTERWVWVMGGLVAWKWMLEGAVRRKTAPPWLEGLQIVLVQYRASLRDRLMVRMHHAEAEHIYMHRSSDWPPGKS
jgi:hypothetical protein